MASGWSVYPDPEFTPLLLRAGALNHGLARRESLLLEGDWHTYQSPESFSGTYTRVSDPGAQLTIAFQGGVV